MHTEDTHGARESKSEHSAADHALAVINKKTGRNLPQAIATSLLLIAVILMSILIKIDAFVYLIIVFMILGLWELRADFAAARIYLPLIPLWLCSAVSIAVTYYSPWHFTTMSCAIMVSLFLCILATTLKKSPQRKLARWAAKKQPQTTPSTIPSRSSKDQIFEKSDSSVNLSVDSPSGSLEKPVPFVDHIAATVFIVLYVTLLACIIVLSVTFNHHPVAHAIMIIFLPALSDTGGLIGGALLGKHKLSPRISPKKSYEGLAGSALLATLGAYCIFAATYSHLWLTYWWIPILLGCIVAVTGTFGDLCASMIKRDIGIKDMGHLLKGHGGVIDRVDSILLAAPLLTLTLWIAGL